MDLFKTKIKKKKDAAKQEQNYNSPKPQAPLTPPQNQSSPYSHSNGVRSPEVDEDGWEKTQARENNDTNSVANRSKSSAGEEFANILEGNVPLAIMPEAMTKFALELEQDINDYLNCNNAETQEKYLIAQDVLRYGLEKAPELIDEAYLQVLKYMQGRTTTSVRGWELLLLLACASRPSAKYLEGVNNFVHSSAHATSQWPTTTSILAKRTWNTLKHNTKAGRRVNVPLVGEIASVLNNKTLRVQITFVDGSNKWLSYDWTTTVSGAVEQLAHQIGLKNYEEYTLFEARKVPKKLDKDGSYSTGTLPPDTYLLLEDSRRIADVVHDYAARGAENKLLLKRRRFDTSGADFSKPQFIALTESHQAAMDEKIAEVANLTLRLREMSGRVMWFENLQAEKNAEAESLKKEVEVLKAKLAAQTPSAEGSADNASLLRQHDQLIQERDELIDQVKQLKAGDLITEELSDKSQNRVIYESQGTNRLFDTGGDKPTYEELSKLLARRNAEILSLKAAYQNADRILMSSDHQHEAELAQAHMANAEQSKTVEELNELVNKLTSQLNLFSAEDRSRGSYGASANRTLSSHSEMLPEPEAVQLGEQLTTMQDAYHRQAEVKIELQAELDRVHQDLEDKDAGFKSKEKEWRNLLNKAKAETASFKSKLRANDAALIQATGDIEQLHAEAGQLRADIETKEQENESLVARVREAEAQGFMGESDSGRSTAAAELMIETLRVELDEIAQERDNAIEKLSVIQSFMAGPVTKTSNSNSGSEYSRKGRSGTSHKYEDTPDSSRVARTKSNTLRQSLDSTSDYSEPRYDVNDPRSSRRKQHRVIHDPLEIGRDPRRESIGGLSAPAHLRHAIPLRVLPEDKRAYGTRHPLFAPNFVQQSPLVASSSSRRDDSALRKEAAAMLSSADAKRRMFKQEGLQDSKGDDIRPAPAAATAPQITDNINRGTHLLGLLSNRHLSASQELVLENGGSQQLLKGGRVDPYRSLTEGTKEAYLQNERARILGSNPNLHPNLMHSHTSFTSLGTEPDLMKSFEALGHITQ